MTESLEPIVKIGVYAALLILVGAHAARWLVRAAPEWTGRDRGSVDRRFARLGAITAAVLAVLLGVRLVAHSAAAFGLADALSMENLAAVGFRSRWGGGWRAQVMAAAVTAVATRWALRRPGATTLLLSTLAAVALACTFPLMGHAAGETTRFVLHGVHLLGGGVWLGTLAVLVMASPGVSLFERFSPLAIGGATLALSSGLGMTWLYLGSIANLWTTTYGRLLSAKLAVLLITAACGLVNWRRIRGGAAPPAATLEAVLALVAVAITAFLTETEHS